MDLIDSGRSVFTIRYGHKHGEDYSIYDEESLALDAAAEIMIEYLEAWGNDAKDVSEMSANITDDIWQAIVNWCDFTGDNESISVDEEIVFSRAPTNIDRLRSACAGE